MSGDESTAPSTWIPGMQNGDTRRPHHIDEEVNVQQVRHHVTITKRRQRKTGTAQTCTDSEREESDAVDKGDAKATEPQDPPPVTAKRSDTDGHHLDAQQLQRHLSILTRNYEIQCNENQKLQQMIARDRKLRQSNIQKDAAVKQLQETIQILNQENQRDRNEMIPRQQHEDLLDKYKAMLNQNQSLQEQLTKTAAKQDFLTTRFRRDQSCQTEHERDLIQMQQVSSQPEENQKVLEKTQYEVSYQTEDHKKLPSNTYHEDQFQTERSNQDLASTQLEVQDSLASLSKSEGDLVAVRIELKTFQEEKSQLYDQSESFKILNERLFQIFRELQLENAQLQHSNNILKTKSEEGSIHFESTKIYGTQVSQECTDLQYSYMVLKEDYLQIIDEQEKCRKQLEILEAKYEQVLKLKSIDLPAENNELILVQSQLKTPEEKQVQVEHAYESVLKSHALCEQKQGAWEVDQGQQTLMLREKSRQLSIAEEKLEDKYLLIEKLQQKMDMTENKLADKHRLIEKLQQKMDMTEKKFDNKHRLIEKLQEQFDMTKKKLENKDRLIEKLQEQLDMTEKKLDDKDRLIEKLQQKMDMTEKKLDDKHRLIEKLQQKMDMTEKKLDDKHRLIEKLQEQFQITKKKLGNKVRLIEKLQEQLDKTEKKLDDKDRLVDKLQEQLDMTEKKLEDKDRLIDQLQQQLDVTEKKLEDKDRLIEQPKRQEKQYVEKQRLLCHPVCQKQVKHVQVGALKICNKGCFSTEFRDFCPHCHHSVNQCSQLSVNKSGDQCCKEDDDCYQQLKTQ